MSSLSFETYLKSIQKNLQKGSERSHYPALKNFLDNPSDGQGYFIPQAGRKGRDPLGVAVAIMVKYPKSLS